MNWLAHLYLSEPTAEFRIGNLLPDMLPSATIATLAPGFQRGAARHRQIDAFTDAHPVFRRSRARIPAPFHRYSGVLMDVFYDHILAYHWNEYSTATLPDFSAEVYASFLRSREHVPETVYVKLEKMAVHDWIGSYRDIAGVRLALERMNRRLRRPFDLAAAMPALEANYAALENDFRAFFPEIIAHFKEG